MPDGWSLAADSPLLPLADRRSGRARFAVAPVTPTGADAGREVEGLLAGAAEVDITPPPGLPKAGYSRNAHTGAGFRTRLRARVLHLRAGTTSLAIVQCDLLGGSAVVHHLVARAVADRTDVPLSGLMIGATHTHGGPGQFLGTRFYNRFASNKPGFDAAWTQRLCERIAGAVVEAVETRRPARMAVGSTEVWGLTRNRSLRPHVRNPSVTDDRTEAQRAYVSVNPHLHLVRVDAAAGDGGFEPLAATAVFSVHGTGVPMRSHEYNADLWAYLVDELGWQIARSHGRRPVVGAIEGTHADVAPALHPGTAGHLEAQRVGRGIGRAAAALYERLEADLTDDVPLAAGLREIDLDRSRSVDAVTLPRRPAVGAALIAGAYENETPVVRHLPPFKAGTPKPRALARGPQGVKWVVGGPFQRLILPTGGFPRVVPVQVLRLGPALLVGLPFEMTVETGRRIEAAVLDRVGAHGGEHGGEHGGGPGGGHGGGHGAGGVGRVIVTSVANEYAGYCATPEEYELQHYEGGHTLYGPRSQPFFTAHAARLAEETLRRGEVTDLVTPRRFDLSLRRYLPVAASASGSASASASVEREVLGPATFTDATARTDPYWEQRWRDVGPGDLHWHEPLVRVESSDREGEWVPAVTDDGRPVDDQGCDVEVVHLGDGHYAARWWNPVFRSYRSHRFVLQANATRPELQ
ncbi:MAG TPA: neutral/alkaline non-lysosomal ceramidase N-terminal domain-containing protein, partial [Acidimicrobiales bacterium]